jgi:hypothetical protein
MGRNAKEPAPKSHPIVRAAKISGQGYATQQVNMLRLVLLHKAAIPL